MSADRGRESRPAGISLLTWQTSCRWGLALQRSCRPDVVPDPGAYGFVNVMDPVAPGLEFDTNDYDSNLIVDGPDTYLFWDEIHPTTAAHALLAELALDSVTFSADFDFDGKVDELELEV
jgi:hypothetical protein